MNARLVVLLASTPTLETAFHSNEKKGTFRKQKQKEDQSKMIIPPHHKRQACGTARQQQPVSRNGLP